MKTVHEAEEKLFWYWINERHRIYLSKEAIGEPKPWTKDKILQEYKFTNVFRELDRTTKWMREHLTDPNNQRPPQEIMFNCCLFRLFGTMEMGKAVGWVRTYDPRRVCEIAGARLDRGEKVFTGAYIITNGGISEPKTQVVAYRYLLPVWENRKKITEEMLRFGTLQHAWRTLHEQPGFGGGGFMAYEVVSDLRHTSVLRCAEDVKAWANAGPGCLRGLRRLFPDMQKNEAVPKMQYLLARSRQYAEEHVPPLEMREIEHSLCEFDKYCRVKFGEGTPRSRYEGGS